MEKGKERGEFFLREERNGAEWKVVFAGEVGREQKRGEVESSFSRGEAGEWKSGEKWKVVLAGEAGEWKSGGGWESRER